MGKETTTAGSVVFCQQTWSRKDILNKITMCLKHQMTPAVTIHTRQKAQYYRILHYSCNKCAIIVSDRN